MQFVSTPRHELEQQLQGRQVLWLPGERSATMERLFAAWGEVLGRQVGSWGELQQALADLAGGRLLCVTNISYVLPGDPEAFATLVSLLKAGQFAVLFHGEPREEGVTRAWLRRAGVPLPDLPDDDFPF